MPRFQATLATAPDNKAPEIEASQDDLNQRAADGFLINGSANKGAASLFAQLAAFGNNRKGTNGLYNGGIGIIFDDSALDARPFSLSGQNTPKAAYNRVTGVATLGGLLRIPHLFQKGPTFFIGYQWTRNRNDAIQSALRVVFRSYTAGGPPWARFASAESR
jgi:trimeric autotransporter adhesin